MLEAEKHARESCQKGRRIASINRTEVVKQCKLKAAKARTEGGKELIERENLKTEKNTEKREKLDIYTDIN